MRYGKKCRVENAEVDGSPGENVGVENAGENHRDGK